MKKKLLELIKDIENNNSMLWTMDYGCDGMNEECCGCGGIEISEYRLVERIKEIIK